MPKYISLGDNAISIGHESDLDIINRIIEINKGKLIKEDSCPILIALSPKLIYFGTFRRASFLSSFYLCFTILLVFSYYFLVGFPFLALAVATTRLSISLSKE